MVATSVALSSTSGRKEGVKRPGHVKPHVMGGSNNLVSERNRREKAEAALQSAKLSLRTVAQDLAPQVQQLVQAVKALQLDKRHQLELDETSQELLEGLQTQINEVEARQQQVPNVVDGRVECAAREINEQSTAERFELRLLIAKLQEVQDEQAAEIRLLQHELIASKEFMAQRLRTIEDSVESVRSEIVRAKEQQHTSIQSHVSKIDDLDEKLFALDKELLKLKLALPSVVAAQIPASFTDQYSSSSTTTALGNIEISRNSGLEVGMKVQELMTDLEALKTDSSAYRSADRKQLGAMTNRMREVMKSHQSLQKEMESRLQEMQLCYDQMVTKVPSELSKRLLKAQSLWDAELQTLKATVQSLEAFSEQQRRNANSNRRDSMPPTEMDREQRKLVEGVRDLQQQVVSLEEEHTAHFMRLDGDLIGLYDWVRGRIAAIQTDSRIGSQQMDFLTGSVKLFSEKS